MPTIHLTNLSSDARHILALGRGVVRTGSVRPCAVCGESPFAYGRALPAMFGDNFSDLGALLSPSAEAVCAGCVSILAGRPGDDPPPLRTMHALTFDWKPMREVADAD